MSVEQAIWEELQRQGLTPIAHGDGYVNINGTIDVRLLARAVSDARDVELLDRIKDWMGNVKR